MNGIRKCKRSTAMHGIIIFILISNTSRKLTKQCRPGCWVSIDEFSANDVSMNGGMVFYFIGFNKSGSCGSSDLLGLRTVRAIVLSPNGFAFDRPKETVICRKYLFEVDKCSHYSVVITSGNNQSMREHREQRQISLPHWTDDILEIKNSIDSNSLPVLLAP